MSSEKPFPWFYFYRIARLSFLVFIPTLFLLLYFYRSTYHAELSALHPEVMLKPAMANLDRAIFERIVPIAFLSYLIFLFFFYQISKPLGSILGMVQQFDIVLPFDRNLELLYKKDEWLRIEEALKEANYQIKHQVQKVKTENEKIVAILESITDKIIAIDPFETVLFFNTKFKQSFMPKREQREIIPKLWHTIEDEAILTAFRDVLKSGEPAYLNGLKMHTSLKPEKYFNLTITPLHNPDGKITGALGVFHDVTEFKLTEQMRVDFVANVSHEIRTPLTSIKGYTQVLESQKSKIPPELHGFMEKIVANTERMIRLFNDLLHLSVIESKNIMKPEPLELVDLVDEVMTDIMANHPSKKVHIQTELKLATITGDHRLIEQVLANLMDNACKYAGDEIQIQVKSYEKDGKAYLEVADQGPGISEEHLPRIFERFYRIDSSREESRGTGLGLSIVKHIIFKHGGRIWAESEGGKGTVFIIELPLA